LCVANVILNMVFYYYRDNGYSEMLALWYHNWHSTTPPRVCWGRSWNYVVWKSLFELQYTLFKWDAQGTEKNRIT